MGKEPVLAGSGWVGKKDVASPPRMATAFLDELFERLVSGYDPLARLRGFFLGTTSDEPVLLGNGRAGHSACVQQHAGVLEGEAAFLGVHHTRQLVGERLIPGEREELPDDL